MAGDPRPTAAGLFVIVSGVALEPVNGLGGPREVESPRCRPGTGRRPGFLAGRCGLGRCPQPVSHPVPLPRFAGLFRSKPLREAAGEGTASSGADNFSPARARPCPRVHRGPRGERSPTAASFRKPGKLHDFQSQVYSASAVASRLPRFSQLHQTEVSGPDERRRDDGGRQRPAESAPACRSLSRRAEDLNPAGDSPPSVALSSLRMGHPVMAAPSWKPVGKPLDPGTRTRVCPPSNGICTTPTPPCPRWRPRSLPAGRGAPRPMWPRRPLISWAPVLAAVGVSVVLVGGLCQMLRRPDAVNDLPTAPEVALRPDPPAAVPDPAPPLPVPPVKCEPPPPRRPHPSHRPRPRRS